MAKEMISQAEARAKGLKRYFTGKPCKRGHISERFVSGCKCILCNALQAPAQRRAYKERHPEKIKERNSLHKLWRNKNLERWREIARLSAARQRDRDPEAYKLRQKKWYDANRDKVAERTRLYAVKFPELRRAISKAWKDRNPENGSMHRRRRRAHKANATGSHTNADLSDILKLQKNRCAYCRIRFGKITKPNLDHIIPLSRGGSDDRKNLQFLCKSCNSRKHAQDPLDFSRKSGMLL